MRGGAKRSGDASSGSSDPRPVLIGRDGELAQIEAAAAEVAAGQARAVFLAGEMGIGKTRLAQEALARARGSGFLVLEGRAHPMEHRLAYAPIVEAFGGALRGLDPSRRSGLVSGLLDLGHLFSDLNLTEPEPLQDAGLERTRLFEAFVELTHRLTDRQPVALFIDDAHWADVASLELLHYVAQRMADRRLLVVATYRSSDVALARGLREMIVALRRRGLMKEIVVSELPVEAMRDLAQSLLGGEVAKELVAQINERAAGVPLFAEALIRMRRDRGQLRQMDQVWALDPGAGLELPVSIREAIAERLEQLGPKPQRVLNTIAVSGEAMLYDDLRAVVEGSDEELLAALQALHVAGLVIEQAVGLDVAYELSHPLIQEVAYGSLPLPARRRIHAALAERIERSRPGDLERLAHHVRQSGREVDPERALAVLLTAGDRARAVFAHEQAAGHFEGALRLIREGRRVELLPTVLERLGEAWERLGEGGAAVAVWAEAVRLLRERGSAQRGDCLAVARIEQATAMAEWDRGHFEAAQRHIDLARQELSGDEPSSALADLLHASGILLGRLGDHAAMVEVARDLTSVAERLGSAKIRAQACLASSSASMTRGDLVSAQAQMERALEAAKQAGEPLLSQRAHDQLHLVAYALGRHRAMRDHLEASLALSERLGTRTLGLYPRLRLVACDLLAGRWDGAERGSIECLVLARQLGVARGISGTLSTRGLVHLQRGELEEAGVCLRESYRVFGGDAAVDHNLASYTATFELMLALEQQDADAITVAAERVRARSRFGGIQFLSRALLAEAETRIGEPERAIAMARQMTALPLPDGPYVTGLSSRVEGLAHREAGSAKEALACLERAASDFDAAETPFEAARARLEWAEIRAGTKETQVAAETALQSLAVFERLGARRHVRRTRKLLNALGIRPRGPRPVPSAALTPRQLEIVRLVADDLTNAEIAARLFISPRTVTTHLDHIYARLNLRSRSALVRYAFENGLLSPARTSS